MTAAHWPSRRPGRAPAVAAAPERPVERRTARTLEVLAVAAAVVMLLIHGQVWYAAFTDYSTENLDSPLLRDIFYLAYAATLLLAGLAPRETARALISSPLLIALVAVTAFSVFWSVAPDATGRRFVALILTTLGGLVLAARWDWPRLAEVLGLAFALMMVGCYVVTFIRPEWGVMQEIFPGAWRGLWVEKNNMGGAMSLAAGLFLGAGALNPRRRWLWALMAVLAVGLVLLSTSKTALVAMLLTFVALAYVWLVKRNAAMAVTMAWAALIVLVLVVLIGLAFGPQVLDWLGKDATLTGRTEIWAGLLRQVETRPWTGFGYGAIWDNNDPYGPLAWITADADYKPNHAHNGWLEVLLNIGLIGLLVWSLWFVEVWARTIHALFASPSAWLVFPTLVAYTLTMITESITLNWHDLRWVLFVAFAAKLAMGEPRAQPQPTSAARRRRSISAWP